ncbi:MAG: DM13 domain-containing protein [Leptolyngbya sp. SIO1D8]|nr:DM13 domain-containing protein [Leptolyngbya sp. SIO1D8]
MKLNYFAALAVSSLLTIGTIAVEGSFQPVQANPCAAQVNPCAANPCAAPEVAAAQTGAFEGVAHPTSGTATIIEEGGKRYLEFDAAFRSDNGPDLFVLLHEQEVPQSYSSDQYVNLGALQSVEGTQRYEIPDDISVEDFSSAVIWCRQFNVTFGYATF